MCSNTNTTVKKVTQTQPRYDGDGSFADLAGPSGSAEIEGLWATYFASKSIPSTDVPFTGRSDYGPFIDVLIPSGGLFTGAETNKTEEEAEMFGGTAGVPLDANYHQAGDTVSNINFTLLDINAQAIAYAISYYAGESGLDGFPEREETMEPEGLEKRDRLERRQNEMKKRKGEREMKVRAMEKMGVITGDFIWENNHDHGEGALGY